MKLKTRNKLLIIILISMGIFFGGCSHQIEKAIEINNEAGKNISMAFHEYRALKEVAGRE